MSERCKRTSKQTVNGLALRFHSDCTQCGLRRREKKSSAFSCGNKQLKMILVGEAELDSEAEKRLGSEMGSYVVFGKKLVETET